MTEVNQPHFESVTETPGLGATAEQLSMLYTRYEFASTLSRDRDVLEVACGAGQGLGYLARVAHKVVGSDIDEEVLSFARRQYSDRPGIELHNFDAGKIPFEADTFDVVLLYEAVYYLDDLGRFLDECRRVLRPEGVVVICTANCELKDFNPSPFSKRYFGASDLQTALSEKGFRSEIRGAFPAPGRSVSGRLFSLVKRAARKLGLIPKTMRGKLWLKRIFLGKLTPLPSEVTEGMATYVPPEVIDVSRAVDYKVIYGIGRC